MTIGAISSVGSEHLVYTEGVGSSNLSLPTKTKYMRIALIAHDNKKADMVAFVSKRLPFFNEDKTFKAKYKKPAEGRSLLMSPFNQFFTWQTTPITTIIESKENYWLFETENSTYLLRKLSDDDCDIVCSHLEAEESI
mgnify:CR=1 FL=1